MDYQISTSLPTAANDCLVVGLWANTSLPECLQALSKSTKTTVKRLHKSLTKERALCWQTDCEPSQLLVMHCGDKKSYTVELLHKIIQDIASALLKQRVSSATIYLPPLTGKQANLQLEHMLTRFDAACYQLLTFKHDESLKHALTQINFLVPAAHPQDLKTAVAIAEGVSFARTLANLPANICTPTYLAEAALALDNNYQSITTTVLDQADLATLNMGAFLAVAQGSH